MRCIGCSATARRGPLPSAPRTRVLRAIARGLRRDAGVHLVGFGTFTVAQRSARKGYNPHTRQPMKIPAMKLVRFKASSSLRTLR